MAGSVLTDTFLDWSNWIIIVLAGLSVSLSFLSYWKRNFFLSTALVVFTLLGAVAIIACREKRHLPSLNGENTFVGRVLESDSGSSKWFKTIVNVNAVLMKNEAVDMSDKVLIYADEKIEPETEIVFRTELMPIRNAGNPGEFDAETFWRGKNIYYTAFLNEQNYRITDVAEDNSIKRFFGDLRNQLQSILERHLQPEEFGLASALVLGDKHLLSQETRSAFGNAGAMHVLAVSGLHVGIVLMLISSFLQLFSKWINRRTAVIISVLLVWIYAGITGFSPSVLRATIMFSCVFLGQVRGRETNSLNSLGFAAFVLFLMDPLVIYDIGFQLSFLAMLGILIYYKPISRWFYIPNKYLLKIWQGTAVGIAAQIVTLPLTLYYFHFFPNYFWLSNLGVMAFSGILLGGGFVLFLSSALKPVAKLIGLLVGFGFYAFIEFMLFIEELPLSTAKGFTFPLWFLLLLFGLIGISLAFKGRSFGMKISVIGALLAIFFVQYERYRNMASNELIVFNTNYSLIGVKMGNQLNVFYEDEERLEKAKLVVLAYTNIRPSTVKMIQLSHDIYNFNSGKFEVQIANYKDYNDVKVAGQMWRLHKNYYSSPIQDGNIYPSYMTKGGNGFQLSEGAFVIGL